MPSTPVAGPKRRARLAAALGIVLLALALYLGTFVVSYGDLLRRDDPLGPSGRRPPGARPGGAGGRRPATSSSCGPSSGTPGRAGSRSPSPAAGTARAATPTGPAAWCSTCAASTASVRIDTAGPRITVESGATWDEVQRAIAPRGLAIKVMQSSNIFTVGGTLSANAHGRDVDVMQVVDVVERFGLLLADGRVVEVSRTENPELFSLVIGGYGMYGVILDVTLRVTRDEVYEQRSESVDYREFPAWFARRVKGDSDVVLMLARPSIDPDPDRFLKEVVAVTWTPGAGRPHRRASS